MAVALDAAHVITVEDAVTLNGLFRERVSRTPQRVIGEDESGATQSHRGGLPAQGQHSVIERVPVADEWVNKD